MKAAVTQFRDRMACLADPSRFSIVLVLAGGEQCVSAIAREVGLSQSCTTRHLQALQRLGLVRGERRGREVMFVVCGEEPEIRLVVEAARHAEGLTADGAVALFPGGSMPRGVRKDPAEKGTPASRKRVRAAEDFVPAVKDAGRPAAASAPAFDRDVADDDGEEYVPRPVFRRPSSDLEDFLL